MRERQRPLLATACKSGAWTRRWSNGTPDPFPLPPPPLRPFSGSRSLVWDWIPGEASPILRLKAEQGRCSKTPGLSAERRLQESTPIHRRLLLPPGCRDRSRGYRRWFGNGIAYGQDRGFCGQRGALGSLSASSS